MSPMPKPPWSPSPRFAWDEFNSDHIARHSVTTWEIEELFAAGGYEVRPHKKRKKEAKFRNRFLVTGKTIGGRSLFVFVDRIDYDNLRVATAFGR